MADFEGIPLFGEGAIGGALLILRMPPAASGVARLPGNAEIEIKQDTPAIVVRGIDASDYESVIAVAPELANKGLDILAMTGRASLGLEDVWLTHAAWWTSGESIIVRFWCSATMLLAITGSAHVYEPDGVLKTPDVEPTPVWQESMRYFRMSELTDDLFDAFRNIYLALESLLSTLAPVCLTNDGRAAEPEKAWFKRALREAAGFVELRKYSANSNRSPVEDIYDELHNHVRNRIFHAKDGLQPFLPQDLLSRAQVAEAKERYGRLYLELAEKVFHTRFPSGGTFLSNIASAAGRTAATKGWRIAFTTDPAPVDKSRQELSPSGEASMALPTSQCIDPRGDDFTAIMAKAEVSKIAALVPAVGRIGTVNTAGQLGLVASLGGRLALAGLNCCEFVVSIGMAGRQTRKTIYAT